MRNYKQEFLDGKVCIKNAKDDSGEFYRFLLSHDISAFGNGPRIYSTTFHDDHRYVVLRDGERLYCGASPRPEVITIEELLGSANAEHEVW